MYQGSISAHVNCLSIGCKIGIRETFVCSREMIHQYNTVLILCHYL